MSFVFFALINNLKSSFYLLDDNFEDDISFGEFESDVFARRCHLAELSYRVQSLLGCDHYTPLTSILFLQELDQHICRIVCKAFRSYGANNVVLAEIFEILSRVFSSFDPKRVILRRFALIWNISIKQHKPFLHSD